METLASHELECFRVHVKAFAPRYRCAWPARVPGRLCVFLDGSMSEASTHYSTSDVVYKPPEDRPRLRFGDRGARTVTVELRRAGLDKLRTGGFDVEEPFSTPSTICHAMADRMYAELKDGDGMTPLVLEGLVFDLFARAHRLKRSRGAPRWLETVRERIDANFARPWTLREYARDAGVDPVALAGGFRRYFQCSVGEHIRSKRVRHAMHELSETRKPIAGIALDAGFCDQSHLSRVFKRQLGITPSEFRRR